MLSKTKSVNMVDRVCGQGSTMFKKENQNKNIENIKFSNVVTFSINAADTINRTIKGRHDMMLKRNSLFLYFICNFFLVLGRSKRAGLMVALSCQNTETGS